LDPDRRHFLTNSFASAAAVCTPGAWPVVSYAGATLSLVPISGRLWQVRGGAANIVLASSGSELLLVDGGAPTDAPPLRRLLEKQFPGQPLKAVFNTHWHWTHTGFNSNARRARADVLAHENTRLWLTTDVHSRLDGKWYPRRPTSELPNRTFHYGVQEYSFGGTRVQYGHLGQAHTDGDIFVRFPEENVIVAGGVFSPDAYPGIDGSSNGWLGGIYQAQKMIAALCDESTRIIPGRGAPVLRAGLQQQQEMCFTVLGRIGENYFRGQTYSQLLDSEPTREFDAMYGNPAQFLKHAHETAWYHVNEIRRVVR
jgi:cyclase